MSRKLPGTFWVVESSGQGKQLPTKSGNARLFLHSLLYSESSSRPAEAGWGQPIGEGCNAQCCEGLYSDNSLLVQGKEVTQLFLLAPSSKVSNPVSRA